MIQDVETIVSNNDIAPTVSKYWTGTVEIVDYTNSEIETYSCVGGDVSCNDAPAVPESVPPPLTPGPAPSTTLKLSVVSFVQAAGRGTLEA